MCVLYVCVYFIWLGLIVYIYMWFYVKIFNLKNDKNGKMYNILGCVDKKYLCFLKVYKIVYLLMFNMLFYWVLIKIEK